MAIGRLSVGTGAKGKALSHAAYVAREGAYEKYTEKGEVLEAKDYGNMPAWAAHDPSVFWQAADAYERSNGTAYREYLVSLPRELSAEQRVELVKAFVAQELGDRHAYQYAIHVPKASDGLGNPHVHLMFSERRNDGIARDPDEFFKRYNAKAPERGGAQKGVGEVVHTKLTKQEQAAELKAMRGRWEGLANSALARAGVDARISMKSYWERGLDVKPEPKQLPSRWLRGGKEAILAFRAARKLELEARRQPEAIIEKVSTMQSVFTRKELYRELHKVTESADLFNRVKAELDVHPSLMAFEDGAEVGGSGEKLTTQAAHDSEKTIDALGEVLSGSGDFSLNEKTLDQALAAQPILSDEQISAVRHVSEDSRLSMISGVAGSGKSTALSVVREGYESAGYRVSGMALAGKAADELLKSSGIESRTIASWLYRYDQGDIELSKKDVVVLDEAGMVNDTTMERVLDAVNRSGAKAILVGDAEQLQPIQAGSPFRRLSSVHGEAKITTVRRQRSAWQRKATQDLSMGNAKAALAAYRKNGCVHEGETDALVPQLVENFLSKPETSAVIFTHRNVDVGMLNTAVRKERKARGELQTVKTFDNGALELGVGDRVVFLKNDTGLDVKNGQFGEVVNLSSIGSGVRVKLDDGREVDFSMSTYKEIAHGYASTIHKSQGMTVDRAMLWGSASLDRHLGYVGMSRHRERLDVYQPAEATRVRTLDACLSRSTRAESVSGMVKKYGLEYRRMENGSARFAKMYPSAAEVDQAKSIRAEAARFAKEAVQSRTVELKQAVSDASEALGVHQQNKPLGERVRDVLMPGANQRWVDWQAKEKALTHSVESAIRDEAHWDSQVNRGGHERVLRDERINEMQADLLSSAGGVERASDGSVVINDRYPNIARDEARSVLYAATQSVKASLASTERSLIRASEHADAQLARHRKHEPAGSKLDVFLYQGAKAEREAWDAKLPELESTAEKAQAELTDWKDAVKDGTREKAAVWKAFRNKAPDAATVNQMTLDAEQKQAQFTKELRAYHRMEKSLESNLGRPLHKKNEQRRDQLLKQFGEASYRDRLPAAIRVQAGKHRESVKQVREQQRRLSRSRGKGLGL